MLSHALCGEPGGNGCDFRVCLRICPALILINKVILVTVSCGHRPDISQACGGELVGLDLTPKRLDRLNLEHLPGAGQFLPGGFQLFVHSASP